MKKLIVAALAVMLMGGGLVGLSAAPAQAGCPYVCEHLLYTKITVHDVTQGHRARVCVKVATPGTGRPRGRVTLTVKRSDGGFRHVDAKKYDGRTCFKTPRLFKTGPYAARVKFESPPNTVWGNSSNAASFRVRR